MKTSNQEMKPSQHVEPEDAIGMLIADHKRVANLFADFKRLTAEERDEERALVVARICQELTVHTQLEEELFYPAARDAIDDDDQMDEAVVEHAGAKDLIAQLQAASPGDELYDAKVTVLQEQIDHHVDEEEGSMFPKVRNSGLDTMQLGAVMLARKSELSGASPDAPPIKSRSNSDDENELIGVEEDVFAEKSLPKSRAAPKKKAVPKTRSPARRKRA